MTNNKKRSERFWQKHIAEWETSGLSKSEYARNHGINKNTFYTRVSKAKKKEDLQLIPLPQSLLVEQRKVVDSTGLYIELPSSIKLQIENNFNQETFTRILQCINAL